MGAGGARRVKPTGDEVVLAFREPKLNYGAMQMRRAFVELSTERSYGMVTGPIPWSRMIGWCEFHGLDYEQSVHLVNVLFHVESIYARRAAAEQKTPPPPTTPPSAPRATRTPKG